ncbi:protein phosphatase 2C domain-containing protein [Paenibacillus thiaminolyticus]|uniref:protein phosphatase 2C domain-containing protein n=1 Tax=Paenibacillus thiaminolyticus TaxID=49283 RepID=UPI00235066BF|nr:protein phosphatase 2C domain-containing protein [Paenibacillus thiaminolyticus]WCR28833.1 protein phosphatase 2C domain-containing protein [Paenibacillus thiaminolyticus]
MQSCHLQGSGIWNEDALVLNERSQVYGVVDGATSLGGYRDESGYTGGYIAAQLLAAHAMEAADGMPLEQMVMQANAALREKMRKAGINTADKAQLWSAAFALFRVREDWIEYVQAGDCMLFAKYADGSYRRLTHDQVAPFDRALLHKRQEALELGIRESAEILRYLLPFQRENRFRANARGGYAVLNGDPELERGMEAGRISRSGLTAIYAVTDGFFHGVDAEKQEEVWTPMLEAIDRQGLEAYAKRLIEREEADSDCSANPRLKISDDKSGIVWTSPQPLNAHIEKK